MCETVLDDATKYWNLRYAWTIHSIIDTMKDVAMMIKLHPEKIMNYFIHRITHARAVGIYSKIAVNEMMAYGFRNKEHLKAAIYYRCGNLKFIHEPT